MPEFTDPLEMLRSVYSHIEAENHEINLADDSKRRWFGFSCVGCTDEYRVWQCPVEAIQDPRTFEYHGGDRLLLNLVHNQVGRISIRDAINRYVHLNVTANRFSQIKDSNHTPMQEDPRVEVNMLESLFMDAESQLITSNYKTIISILRASFRSNIPSRYKREPVI